MSRINIIFASQTGNAEELAYDFHNKLKTSNLLSIVQDIRDVDLQSLCSMEVTLFFVSTTGNGDQPDGMRGLWKQLLRKALPATLLNGMQIAVFGLGDSSYEQFNVSARKLYARLIQLGAKSVIELTLGDDQAPMGYLSAFSQWESKALQWLEGKFRTDKSSEVQEGVLLSDGISTSVLGRDMIDNVPALNTQKDVWTYLSDEVVHSSTVLRNSRISASDWFQDVRHIKLETTGASLDFEPGDVSALYYQNSDLAVERGLRLLGPQCSKQSIIVLRKSSNNARKSRIFKDCQLSVETLLKYVLDLDGVPKRGFFQALEKYASSTDIREKLIEISSSSGADLYFDYCVREGRSHLDVMDEFKLLNIPVEDWINNIPIIQPRSYSIASSPLFSRTTLDLCIAIKERKTPYGRVTQGLCSKYVQSLSVGSTVCHTIRLGIIRGTRVGSTIENGQIICVGTGTGIAPLRSIIQHKCMQFSQQQQHLPLTPVIQLVHGCRRERKDDLFAEEWAKLSNGSCPYTEHQISNSFFRSVTAYSQQSAIKRYVSHSIKENATEIVTMLENGSSLLISGSSKRMPKDVIQALTEAFVIAKSIDHSEAALAVQTLQKLKSIVIDAW